MGYFRKTRNVELSVIKHIETQVNTNWTGITVVKSFLQAYSSSLPVIAVRMINTDSFRKEIGDNELRQKYSFIVDIFAKSDGQRLDLADFMVNILKDGVVYYAFSHASGNSETLNETADGRITLLTFDTDGKVDSGDNTLEHERYRHSITFTVEKYA